MENKDNKIFRQDLIDKLSTPEELTDYIKVIKPSTWAVIFAGLFFLVGLTCWAIFGSVKTKVPCFTDVENGISHTYVYSQNKDQVKEGMLIYINDMPFRIEKVSKEPYVVDTRDANLDWGKYDIDDSTLIYEVYPKNIKQITFEDGMYDGEIIIDSVSPLTFLFS